MDPLTDKIKKILFDRVEEYPMIKDLSAGSVRHNTAIHEAGHGVIAFHYKLNIEYLKINKSNYNRGKIKLVNINLHAATESCATAQLKTHFAGIISQRLYTDSVEIVNFCGDAEKIGGVLGFGYHFVKDLVPLFDKTKEKLSKPEMRSQIEILANHLNDDLYLTGKRVYEILEQST